MSRKGQARMGLYPSVVCLCTRRFLARSSARSHEQAHERDPRSADGMDTPPLVNRSLLQNKDCR